MITLALVAALVGTPDVTVEDRADVSHPAVVGAAIGGGVGSVVGLAVIGGYLMTLGSEIQLPFDGYSIFLVVPACTTAGAGIGALTAGGTGTEIAAASAGGLAAGTVGGVVSVGVGLVTAFGVGSALQAANPQAQGWDSFNLGVDGIIAGAAAGIVTQVAISAVTPALFVGVAE